MRASSVQLVVLVSVLTLLTPLVLASLEDGQGGDRLAGDAQSTPTPAPVVSSQSVRVAEATATGPIFYLVQDEEQAKSLRVWMWLESLERVSPEPTAREYRVLIAPQGDVQVRQFIPTNAVIVDIAAPCASC